MGGRRFNVFAFDFVSEDELLFLEARADEGRLSPPFKIPPPLKDPT